MGSKVYYTDMRARPGRSLLDKLRSLMKAAGMEEIDFQDKFVAIKLHFGEPGNLSFLRPNFARAVADEVKRLGGKPFLTDCNTLYVGRRKNALEHLETAAENGFNLYTCGCPVIIADGLKGTDEAVVPLTGTDYVKNARIGRAVMDVDIVISLNHFKGHEATGFGGAVKNLGMGCGSRAGKMEQHCDGKPVVDPELCRSCHTCARWCAQNAISFETGKAHIDTDKCVGCGRCMGECAFDAIHNPNWSGNTLLCRRMAEYALAVVQGRSCFHISIAAQISPNCDCHGENDLPIIPDAGMFASFDPVALDTACADMCNRMPPIPGSQLSQRLEEKEHHFCHDHFDDSGEGTHWRDTMEHGAKIGLGSMEYELIQIH